MAQEASVATQNGSPKTAPAKAGLEDVVAGVSQICLLDGKRGILAYRGYDIHDLVKGTFEETAYLLIYGTLPNKEELASFNQKLVQSRKLPQQIMDRLQKLPKNIHPMSALRTLQSEVGLYDPQAEDGRAVFDYVFPVDTELTGHMSLHLWVEAIGADDMDLFVGVQKFDRRGEIVPFVFYALLENGPVALGWLRVSHRELDSQRSTPEQPVHPHTREQLLTPGERVAVDVEIWPSSTLFRAGERLRLVVQGQDVMREGLPNAPFARHENTRNRGTHVIHTGGDFDSFLLVPDVRSPQSPGG